jgi:hypothetical protein
LNGYHIVKSVMFLFSSATSTSVAIVKKLFRLNYTYNTSKHTKSDLNGYHGDNSAMFLVGDVDAAGRRLCEVTKTAMDAAIAVCAPGVEFNGEIRCEYLTRTRMHAHPYILTYRPRCVCTRRRVQRRVWLLAANI